MLVNEKYDRMSFLPGVFYTFFEAGKYMSAFLLRFRLTFSQED